MKNASNHRLLPQERGKRGTILTKILNYSNFLMRERERERERRERERYSRNKNDICGKLFSKTRKGKRIHHNFL